MIIWQRILRLLRKMKMMKILFMTLLLYVIEIRKVNLRKTQRKHSLIH